MRFLGLAGDLDLLAMLEFQFKKGACQNSVASTLDGTILDRLQRWG
jgi:hypothetical protein